MSNALEFPIRSLQVSDGPAVFRVLEAARSASQVSIGPKWTESQIQSECRERGLVANEPSGPVRAFLLWRDNGEAWEISFLATEPAFQGRGLMTALLRHMIAELPEDRAIWLEVHEANHSARALYEKAGFIQNGERPRYYADGGTAVLYALTLL